MNPPEQLKVVCVIVNYHSKSNLLTALTSLEGQSTSAKLTVTIVNNSPDEDLSEVLPRPLVKRLITPGINIGFGRAVNLAVVQERCDYILLINPDSVLEEQVVERLVTFAEGHQEVAIVAPRIIYPDGRLQPSRGKFPTVLSSLAFLFNLKKLMPRDEIVIHWTGNYLGKFFGQYRPMQTLEFVDYAVGSCLLIRHSAFQAVNGFDPRFFLFYEEIDLAWRLKRQGWTTAYLSEITVVHMVGQSYAQDRSIGLREKFLSMLHYFAAHGAKWESVAIRFMQILSLSLKLAWLRLNQLLVTAPTRQSYQEQWLYSAMLSLLAWHPQPRFQPGRVRALVSACLAGVKCTYDATSRPVPSLLNRPDAVVICPEHAGGLPTPRRPAWLVNGSGEEILAGHAKVVDSVGLEVTKNFVKGAYLALLLARLYAVQVAILKARSPSCGTGEEGNESEATDSVTGVTAALLRQWGIYTFTEDTMDLRWLGKTTLTLTEAFLEVDDKFALVKGKDL